MDNLFFGQLAKQLAQLFPSDAPAIIKQDFERNARALLQSALQQADLVTREDFDIQRTLLERTREKLTQLEKRLGALEQAEDQPAHKDAPATPGE